MMNWEEIAARIENPLLCSQYEIQDLKDFCEKFPYSQVFPLLYLKVLSQGKQVNFEEELERYAHKITDRVQLYNLLYMKEDVSSVPISKVDEEIKEIELQEEKLEVEEVLTLISTSESDSSTPENREEVLVEEEVPVNEIQVDLPIETTEIFPEENVVEEIINDEIIPNVQEESDFDELEKEIMASSATAAFVLEELEPELTDSELPEFDLSIVEENEVSESELEVLPASTINQINSSEKTFLEWLTNSSNPSLNEEIVEDESSYEVSYIEFEKPKKEFFSPIKKAKESLSEETLPVSETLAKIYQAQGNISKAIYVYQQLSLIIPEKKSYFASQIKSLKKKIN